MPAIVGVLLSYASLVAGVAGGSAAAADICAPGDACELPSNDDVAPIAYATPAEVDCRAMSDVVAARTRNDLQLFSGGCNQPIGDFRYRVSRFPDSERSSGGLGPERARRAVRSAETCTGLPPRQGSLVSASAPPLAIYAYTLIPLPPLMPARVVPNCDRLAPNRIVEPPDRPPRG